MMMTNSNNNTFETVKSDKCNIDAIIKKINNGQLLTNHPSQRMADQWTNKMKGNLISDILQGNHVPELIFAEQIINGMSIVWVLDGKQRCTNVYNYVCNGFKICKGIRRNIIKYQAIVKDENGKIIKDENGIPTSEWREFDIINKTFSQLPEELQDRIMNYCFNTVLWMNCSDEDISYHIDRYNDGKPMNKSQKGIIKLGQFANNVKKIASMDFFTDCDSYTDTDEKKGTIDRIVSETIMAENFLDDWKKNHEDMCEYLNDNATEEMFEELGSEIEVLEELVSDEHSVLFNTKDSFIWFTLFHRAMNSGVTEEEFVEFLDKCVGGYRDKEINGNTLNSLAQNKNTKDKSLIIAKLNHLENLLYECCGKEVA